jgi:hypothetical protein
MFINAKYGTELTGIDKPTLEINNSSRRNARGCDKTSYSERKQTSF